MARTPKEISNNNFKTEEAFKKHVEWLTGGRNGGTCHRPDIVTRGPCTPCEYVKYCLCDSKTLVKKK